MPITNILIIRVLTSEAKIVMAQRSRYYYDADFHQRVKVQKFKYGFFPADLCDLKSP